jgi:hypothetical protein
MTPPAYYSLPPEERQRLRSLARRQAELAALPIMRRRRQLWIDINDGVRGTRPPFAIETWTFDRDFLPDRLLQCRTDYGRRIERTLLRHIRHHEILGDDHVCPDTFDIAWHTWCDEFGIEIPEHHAEDAEGVEMAYRFEHPIQNLCDGFAMLKPSTYGVDREGTLAEKAFLEELFGDLLPVVIREGPYGRNSLTQRALRLMSMETFFMALYDCPDQVHALMAYLRDNAINLWRWAEREGLLVLNNGNQCTCGTCFNFTTKLPKRPVKPGEVKLSDLWTGMDSQETVGVSPDLFHEMIFPYYRDIAALFGFVYWGCCEPVDPIWEKSISQLPNLRAVSISRWANQAYMAEALEGRSIVFSRKPNPNLLGVSAAFDEEAWAEEIRKTLELTAPRGLPTEFVVRDVYSLHGNLDKARRAVEIARREIDRFYPPLSDET